MLPIPYVVAPNGIKILFSAVVRKVKEVDKVYHFNIFFLL